MKMTNKAKEDKIFAVIPDDDEFWDIASGVLSACPIDENDMIAFNLTQADVEDYYDSNMDAEDILCEILKKKGLI